MLVLFVLLLCAQASRPVRVFFANPKYEFVDDAGRLRTAVLRNSVGAKGLPRAERLVPCVEDAELLSEFDLLEAEEGDDVKRCSLSSLMSVLGRSTSFGAEWFRVLKAPPWRRVISLCLRKHFE